MKAGKGLQKEGLLPINRVSGDSDGAGGCMTPSHPAPLMRGAPLLSIIAGMGCDMLTVPPHFATPCPELQDPEIAEGPLLGKRMPYCRLSGVL